LKNDPETPTFETAIVNLTTIDDLSLYKFDGLPTYRLFVNDSYVDYPGELNGYDSQNIKYFV